jgi:ribonuclease J
LPLDQVVILTTGSQGEPLSALSRIANNEHKQIKIIPGDTVVISATPIPGNERSVANTINALFLRGANVVYGRGAGVHVSGHACREEQKLMINLCKPKFFMPLHGEYRMLVRHAELAVECNVDPEHTFVMENGEILEVSKDKAHVSGRVSSGVILIDSSRAFEIDESIVEQRQHIAEDGLVMVAMSVDQSSKLLAGPDVSLRGLILPKGVPAEEFVIKVQDEAKRLLTELSGNKQIQKEALKQQLALALTDYFEENVKASPFVQIILNEVSEAKSRSRQSTSSRADSKT